MKPLGTKKQPLVTTKSRNISGDKITQALRTKKVMQPLKNQIMLSIDQIASKLVHKAIKCS